MQEEQVVLVNRNDEPVGTMEKMKAHEQAVLHRAFSIYIFNSKGEVLLHRRALEKYHSGGLWTNTCCSHPRPGEDIADAANRRLMEEMGMEASLTHLFHFVYKSPMENGLTEHELDHVFLGISDDAPNPVPEEVCEWKYVDPEVLIAAIDIAPEQYTSWFKLSLSRVLEHLQTQEFTA